jgi:hypothetical protein
MVLSISPVATCPLYSCSHRLLFHQEERHVHEEYRLVPMVPLLVQHFRCGVWLPSSMSQRNGVLCHASRGQRRVQEGGMHRWARGIGGGGILASGSTALRRLPANLALPRPLSLVCSITMVDGMEYFHGFDQAPISKRGEGTLLLGWPRRPHKLSDFTRLHIV